MTGRTIVAPASMEPGNGCFGYVIAENDMSMVGTNGASFPPGTEAVFDADQDVLPDNFLLCRPKGMKSWLLRQYKAGLPISVACEYSLHALNPAVEAIRVTNPELWEIAGRLVITINKW